MKPPLLALAALLLAAPFATADVVTVTGELKKWHKVTFRCQGPATDETATPNPFTDYRLNAVFTHPASGQTYTVPGYYAADGSAAETSASGGDVWQVHFAPDRVGTWSYSLSFRTGSEIAIDSNPAAGTSAGNCDGATGTFEVLATDKSGHDLRGKGRLEYVGKHHLRFAETGEYFMKCGTDSPENLLAYEDFDGTPNAGARRKSWAPHQPHYDALEAGHYTWQAGKGSELLGAIRYLSTEGLNGFSFLTFSLDGDDDNVFPHLMVAGQDFGTSGNDTRWGGNKVHHNRFDVSKLEQWERVLCYGTSKGMHLHFKTQETENDQEMDGGALGPERKLYYRELVARFSHHLALNWNLGEENSNSEAERKAFAQWFFDNDPYRHPVVMHTFETNQGAYNPLLGAGSKLTGASLQIPDSNQNFSQVFQDSLTWVNNSSSAGKPWVIACDESGQSGHSLRPDNDAGASHEDGRKNALWGNPLAGGAGLEWYFGSQHAHSDISCQDFASRDAFWPYCQHMLSFWETSGAPFWDMKNGDALDSNPDGHCLYKLGEYYVIQLKSGGTTNLTLPASNEPFEVWWFDPRNGGTLQAGSVATVSGGGSVNLGSAPSSPTLDWIVLVREPVAAPPAIQVEHPADNVLQSGIGTLDFGTVFMGYIGSTAKSLTIRNTGGGPLDLSTVTLSGTGADSFAFGSLGTSSLAPGETTEFSVSFTPVTPGGHTATLHIPSNDPDDESFDIALTGAGAGEPDIAVEQPAGTGLPQGATLEMGSADVNGAPQSVDVTVRNTGSDELAGLAAALSDDETGAFTIVTPPPATIAPGESAVITLAFDPQATVESLSGSSEHAATLTLTSDDPDEDPFVLSLTGTGLHPDLRVTVNGGIEFTGDLHGHDFGRLAAGASQAFTVTVQNSGMGPLTGSFSLSGDDSYSIAGSTDFSLGPEQSQDFVVTFSPPSPGARLASATIASNDLSSGAATVNFSGTGNSPPLLADSAAGSIEDAEAGSDISLQASDTDGDLLRFEILTLPQHGTLLGIPLPEQTYASPEEPTLTYFPAANYHGPDSFTYRVSDGLDISTTATVSITVLPFNDPPTTTDPSTSTDEDTPLAVTLAGEDVDGDSLTYTLLTLPLNGTVELTGGIASYSPEPDFHGSESFSYQVSDGVALSNIATVTVTVLPINDAPMATDQSAATIETTPWVATLLGSDVEGDPLTYTIVTSPSNGTVELAGNIATYTPDSNFHGPDSFSYRISDGLAFSNTATVTISVTPINDPPVVTDSSVATNEDTPLAVTLSGMDADDDPLTFSIVTPPSHGTLDLAGNTATYTPDPDYHGADSFTFTANDGQEPMPDSQPATVALAVASVNDAPATNFELFSLNEDQSLSVLLTKGLLKNDSDFHDGAPAENNAPLTAVLADAPPHAQSFTLFANGTFLYTPGPNFHGLDSFTYRAVDSLGGQSEPETVLIAVRAANDTPVAESQTLSTLEDVPLTIRLRGADIDAAAQFDPAEWPGLFPPASGPAPYDAALIHTITTAPSHGTLTGTAPNLAYTPHSDFHGTDTFRYTVSDGLASSAEATVTIAIQPDHDADILPDTWEMNSFASLAWDGGDDPDRDGQDNSFELIAGHDPSDANSRLTLEFAGPSPTDGILRLNHVRPGVVYTLEASDHLGAWEGVAEVRYEIEGPGAIYDPREITAPRQFYRIGVTAE